MKAFVKTGYLLGASVRAMSLGVVSLALLSCAGMELERDVRSLERKLGDVRNFQAEQTSEISALEARVRELSGRLDDLEHTQRVRGPSGGMPAQRPSIASPQIESAMQSAITQSAITPPSIVPAGTLEVDEAFAASLTRSEVAKAFGDALISIRSGKYAEALPLLQGAERQNFGGQGAAEIVFWKGVCYDGLGDNRRALAAYGELVSSYAKHPRAALGLLRQGSVFMRLGDSATAKLTFQKLIADFPGSAEAAMAQQRSKDL